MAFTAGGSAPFPSNLKPAHLPMSDDEDTTEEPYSHKYHAKVAEQMIAQPSNGTFQLDGPKRYRAKSTAQMIIDQPSEPGTLQLDGSKRYRLKSMAQMPDHPSSTSNPPDDAHDDTAQFPTEPPGQQKLHHPIQNNSSTSSSSLQIVSVCSLPRNSNLLQPDAHNNNSSSSSMPDTAVNGLLQVAPVRRVFGIAQTTVDGSNESSNPSHNDSDSNPDQLLVEQKARSDTRKAQRGRPAKAPSKLLKMRHKLNKRFKAQQSVARNVIHLPVLDNVSSGATTTDDQEDVDEEPEETQEEQQVDVKPQMVPMKISRATSRRKTTHQPMHVDEDEIEFVTDDTPVVQMKVEPDKRSASSIQKADRLDVVRQIVNPNADLMKKVAFLRTCVNYMMKELGRKQFVFERGMSFATMKAHYHANGPSANK